MTQLPFVGLIDLARFAPQAGAKAWPVADGGVRIETPPAPFANAVAWPVAPDGLPLVEQAWEQVCVEGTILVESGEAILALVARDASTHIDEITLTASPEPQPFRLNAIRLSDVLCLLLKTGNTRQSAMAILLDATVAAVPQSQERLLHAFYDLDWMPISFDFSTFMMAAEIERARQGLEGITLHLVPGRHDGLRLESKGIESALPQQNRLWRVQNLLLPMAGLLPTVKSCALLPDREAAFRTANQAERVFPGKGSFRSLSLADLYQMVTPKLHLARNTERFTAPEQGKRYVEQWLSPRLGARKLVTITLRQSPKAPERNSRLTDWRGFADGLDPTSYLPVFVPDTDAALDERADLLGSHPCLPEAAFNLGLRLALYESAHVNLLTSGGPILLCQYNPRCKYLYFKPVVEGCAEAEIATQLERGYLPGQSPPYATPFQRWIWQDDKQEAIEAAFAEMSARIG